MTKEQKAHQEYCLQKQKKLLTWLKNESHNEENQDSEDIELFNREVARYFKVEHKVNEKKICWDKRGGSKAFPLKVNTHMFGGCAKHINLKEYHSFKI